MKKIILVLLIGAGLFGAYMYLWNDSAKVEDLKQEILEPSTSSSESVQEASSDSLAAQDRAEESSSIQIIALSENQFLDFDSLDIADITDGEIEISGTSNTSVETISVDFSNPSSDYPDDSYTLQTYKPELGEFVYRASSKNKVLDYGVNNYIFTATSGGETSQTKIVIVFEDENAEPEQSGVETDILGYEENLIAMDFPTSSKYGEPIKLWEASFTYSGIKGLEVNKELFEAPSCDGITEFLTDRLNTWFYWNTCRDIVVDYGIKFNVIRLSGDEYIYERHYLDFRHGLYGVYELETGTGVDTENIAEKNNELKEREFPVIEIVDDLMKDIVNS